VAQRNTGTLSQRERERVTIHPALVCCGGAFSLSASCEKTPPVSSEPNTVRHRFFLAVRTAKRFQKKYKKGLARFWVSCVSYAEIAPLDVGATLL